MLSIYKASAGSGKTYKLAYEYIRALLGVKIPGTDTYKLNLPKYLQTAAPFPNRHRYILAITFTNKATEEMKRRIVDQLDALTAQPVMIDGKLKDADYAEDLCKEFGCSRSELAEVSTIALRQLLYDYNAFSVTTIDSFFQKVLRTFARELDRQGDFSIELNDNAAVQAAVDTMLDDFNIDISKNQHLAAWIYDYLYQQLQDGSKTNFFNRKSKLHSDLVKMVAKVCEEQFKPYANRMKEILREPYRLNRVKHAVADTQHRILDRIKLAAQTALDQLALNGKGLESMRAESKVRKSIQNEILKGKLPDGDLFNATFEKYVAGMSSPFNKSAKVSAEDEQAFITMLIEVRRLYCNHKILDDVKEALDTLMLLGFAWGYIDNLIAQNNLVLLSDTNHLLSRIIGRDETPFIYERMGVQFRHFLIDEFQDTSRMQWANLKPLVANGLSNDHDSLIIGDEKQSIYRFRNSDPSLLHTQVAEVDFTAPRYNTQVKGGAPGENTNYRSSGVIVRFNNTLFTLLANGANKIEGFENVIQDIPAANRDIPGFVSMRPYESNSKSKDEGTDTNPLDDLIQNILRQHDEGHYAWSDIAILVDTNIQGMTVVEHIVSTTPRIPVISDEALFVRKSNAVQLIIGTLELLANHSKPALPGAPKPKYPSATEIALDMSRFTYYCNKGLDAQTALKYSLQQDEVDPALAVDNCIDMIRKRKPSSLVALVETIILELIPEDERRSQMAYLNAFQDYVIDFCAHNTQTIRALLNHWTVAKEKLSISSSSDIDAVKVMTIHKSKGLEFDCVHIPFGSWTVDGRYNTMWVPFPKIDGVDEDICPPALSLTFSSVYSLEGTFYHGEYVKDLQERRIDIMNKTYVAYTRAARELIIYYNPSKEIGRLISETLSVAPSDNVNDYRLMALGAAYDPKTGEVTVGSPTAKIVKPKRAQSGNRVVEPVSLPDYCSYYHADVKVITSVDDMLDLDDDIQDRQAETEAEAFEYDEVSRQRGVALHDMLSHITTLDDIEDAVDQVTLSNRLPSDVRDDAIKFITEMLNPNSELVYRWFVDNKSTVNEQSIYLPEGDKHRYFDKRTGQEKDYRRPDRIVFCNDGSVDVVDYKFTTRTSGAHVNQVNEYIDILKSMGYQTIRGYLWYPFLGKIVTV